MSKIKVGDIKAYLGPKKYFKIGVLYKEDETQGESRFSIKIDGFPAHFEDWRGWCNVFVDGQTHKTAKAPPVFNEEFPDDDIPF